MKIPNAPTAKGAKARLAEIRAEVAKDVEVWTNEKTRWDDAPLVVCLILLALAAFWVARLQDDNRQLRIGPPHSYRVERRGFGVGPDFRAVTDGWTSNVGTKASAIRQAWEHRDRTQAEDNEWRNAE